LSAKEDAFAFALSFRPKSTIISDMSADQATAEVFVIAFKSLKRSEREAVFERLLKDEELADTFRLEARRHQPRQAFRQALKEMKLHV
jgi:hypothetical protein